ncbi:MAG TPA: ribonuclease Z [Solirubrobacteraceae bacterium]|nr:ribonuclease Z [Solirubrobacteraceae bacterium]
MELSIFFAGTGGSVPSRGRGLPAIVVQRGGERLLFDCGEGTQRQLLRSIGLPDFERVFITHFHADHWLGLPGMLKTFALRERSAPLTVYGPPGLTALMDSVRPIFGRSLPYRLSFVEIESWGDVAFDGYKIASVPVQHGGREAYGYVLAEDDRPGEFDPAAAEALGVPSGPMFGLLQRGTSIEVDVGGSAREVRPDQVMGDPRPGRRIAISGDTSPCEALSVAAHGVRVLVHEATFMQEDRDRARDTGHSTAHQAALIAHDAEAELLALTHISARYKPSDVLAQARESFEPVVAPRDFDTIEVPQHERGAPHVVTWEERRRREPVESIATP